MSKQGLFVGLATLDLIYLTTNIPQTNQKIVAIDQTIAAGGPATNAAVTFSYLGNQATLLGIVGSHPISQLIRSDLEAYSVKLIDLDLCRSEPPPASSIMITQPTGERAVISINAIKFQANTQQLPPNILENVNIVLIDGHQLAISQAITQQANASNIPVVIDAGSWKLGLEEVLPYINYAICSANFYPPNCHNQEDVFNYLQELGISNIAITQGEKPIQYFYQNQRGELTILSIKAVDTLGAGDIFHGAFCHYILQNNFLDALIKSAEIASYSCQYFGTRQWMQKKLKVEG